MRLYSYLYYLFFKKNFVATVLSSRGTTVVNFYIHCSGNWQGITYMRYLYSNNIFIWYKLFFLNNLYTPRNYLKKKVFFRNIYHSFFSTIRKLSTLKLKKNLNNHILVSKQLDNIKIVNNFNLKYFVYLYNIFVLSGDNNKRVVTTPHFLDYQYTLQSYFYSIFKINFFLNFVNISDVIPLGLAKDVSQQLINITPKNFKLYYFIEISEIILASILTKNLNFLVSWLKPLFEKRSIKFFSAICSYLNIIFEKILWPYRSQYLSFLGFYIRFKGKFLKGGGKKKKVIFQQGLHSSSRKDLRLVYKKFYIRTISGVIGCSIKLAF